MATRVEDAIGRLADRLQEEDGRAISYQQGSAPAITGTAVPNDETYKIFEGDGTFTQHSVTDWLIRSSVLSTITPRPGDRISVTINGEARIYELQPIDTEPCFDQHDDAGLMFVLHTQRIQ